MGANRLRKARGCAEHTVVASDVNILTVVARVLKVQHRSAKRTAVASDADILKVVTRVLNVKRCFA
jgi:hypothetical protein